MGTYNQHFIFDKYIITFPNEIKYEKFNEKDYYGINFHIEGIDYELIHNYLLGNRLLINGPICKDLPFKFETFIFLPTVIKVEEA